jgi:hypothetical protein
MDLDKAFIPIKFRDLEVFVDELHGILNKAGFGDEIGSIQDRLRMALDRLQTCYRLIGEQRRGKNGSE